MWASLFTQRDVGRLELRLHEVFPNVPPLMMGGGLLPPPHS